MIILNSIVEQVDAEIALRSGLELYDIANEVVNKIVEKEIKDSSYNIEDIICFLYEKKEHVVQLGCFLNRTIEEEGEDAVVRGLSRGVSIKFAIYLMLASKSKDMLASYIYKMQIERSKEFIDIVYDFVKNELG